MVTSVPQSRQLLDPDPLPLPLPELEPPPVEPVTPLDDALLDADGLLLCDELLPDDMLPDPDGLPSVELALLPVELPPLPDVPPPPEVPPPPDVPPPPEVPPPPDVPPPEVPPPPLDDGDPSVLLGMELEGLLDGVAVSVLLIELDTESVELGVGVPGSLELGVWLLLLRLDVPLPGGCWVVAHTGM